VNARGNSVAVLAFLLALASCGGEMKKSNPGVKDRNSIVAHLDNYSSRAFDAIALHGNPVSNDTKIDRPCGLSNEMTVLGVNHFWQLESVDPVQQAHGVARLHDYLESEGWEISTYDASRGVVNATNPRDGYVVWAKGIEGLNRVAVQVSSPCFKISKESS
jgi:hypothetical protein